MKVKAKEKVSPASAEVDGAGPTIQIMQVT